MEASPLNWVVYPDLIDHVSRQFGIVQSILRDPVIVVSPTFSYIDIDISFEDYQENLVPKAI